MNRLNILILFYHSLHGFNTVYTATLENSYPFSVLHFIPSLPPVHCLQFTPEPVEEIKDIFPTH